MTRTVLLLAVLCSGAGTLAAQTSKPLVADSSSLLSGTPEAFLTSCHSDLDEAKKRVAELKATKPPREAFATLQALDTILLLVTDAGNRSGLAEQVHPTKAFRDAAQKCEQEANSVYTDFTLDRDLYAVLASLEGAKLDPAGSYYLRTTLRDYHRAGVDRDDATRAKIKAMQDELVKIGQQFDQNIAGDVRKLQVTPADMNGLPEDFKRSHPADASGKITLTTDNTDYVPFMEYSTSEPARKAFYILYRQRAYPKNIAVLSSLLEKRYELAGLLGYPDWASYATEDKMVGTEQNATDFIDKISVAATPGAQHDYEELLAAKKLEDPKAEAVNLWDVGHLTHAVEISKYGYDSQAVRPYFEYSRVVQGILDLTSKMYGIRYQPVKDAKVWHPDVAVYDVFDGEKRLGRIYFDMFPRENKFKHYATFDLATGKEGYRLPEYVLVCNFPQGMKGEPGLMERDDVIVFFHEYGHLLHGIFRGNTQWATGDLENDFVEAPSQMFEEWPKDPAILQTFARHYQTNQPIPVELAQKARASDDLGRALGVRSQMFYAAMSLDYYKGNPKDLDTTKMMAQLQEKYTPFKYVADTHMQTSFGHLNGYSAVYCTYMWSLVIAKDMFTEFEKGGLMNPEIAAKYRADVLAASGTMPAADLVKDFLGRPYSFEAYAEWLNGTAGATRAAGGQ
jgi:thimet oligopeptidase